MAISLNQPHSLEESRQSHERGAKYPLLSNNILNENSVCLPPVNSGGRFRLPALNLLVFAFI